ncbi:MAG: carbonic anhydrase [Acidobacteriota bacterium]|nr:carbonic anhydrase [Acidobacteriota bacterium]
MEELIAGYRRFRATGWPERRKLFESLAEDGQRPKALVLACVDSRVDPAMIFDAGPGELLTVRNVANLVPPYEPDSAYHGTSAALEFGVRVLEIPDLIVLGHGMCGGVKALLEGAPEEARDFVGPWMSIAEAARFRTEGCSSAEERQQSCEYEVIKVSLANLMTFPWIAERVAAGKLVLHGAWFAIHSGLLMTLRPDGSFGPADSFY